MTYTLRVTDEMINNWQIGMLSNADCRCPLSQALKVELLNRGIEPGYMLNASSTDDGHISYTVGGFWYVVRPRSSEVAAVKRFIFTVDYRDKLPTKRTFHYSDPEPRSGWPL